MKRFKLLVVLVLLTIALGLVPSVTRADGPISTNPYDQTSSRNGVEPNYAPTVQELKAITTKQALAKQYVEQKHVSSQIQPNTPGSHQVQVGVYREPNDYAHRNYCGPAATQVILSARLPANQIPDIDTIGRDENIDPNSGVYNTAIRNELNRVLNTSWYVYSIGNSQTTVMADIIYDVDAGWALDTSMWTYGMPGWGQRDVRHIVAIYGYYESAPYSGSVYYTESGGSAQGSSGTYWNIQGLPTFYSWINAHAGNNNSQVW